MHVNQKEQFPISLHLSLPVAFKLSSEAMHKIFMKI